jgi:hypothetical protein
MASNDISRRQAGAIMLSGAAIVALLSTPGARASLVPQPAGGRPRAPGKSKPDKQPGPTPVGEFEKLLIKGKTHDWTLKVVVNVQAFVERDSKGMPVVHDLSFDSAAVVFPLLKSSSWHKIYTNEVKGTLKLNDIIRDTFDGSSPDRDTRLEDKYPCGTRLARWTLKNESGREVELEVNIPCTCWQTIFDEARAEKVPWPATWPAVPMSTFQDVQPVTQAGNRGNVTLIDHMHPEVRELVTKWSEGKDPKTVNPVPLAKFYASQVLEMIQPSGDGLNFHDTGQLEGLTLQGSTATIQQKRGTDHDIACVLAAVYRAAGLPARIVIGYDVRDQKGDDKASFLARKRSSVPAFRSLVEFCLYDETEKKELWVPVDINRQRKVSSRAPSDGSWRFFGDHDELDQVVPFAFQYHPPTSVMAHGSISFWGWLTLPEAQVAKQFLRFNAMTTAKSATTKQDREKAEQDEKNKPPQSP